jgi:hypothetical protein
MQRRTLLLLLLGHLACLGNPAGLLLLVLHLLLQEHLVATLAALCPAAAAAVSA